MNKPTKEQIREVWENYNPMHGIESFAYAILEKFGQCDIVEDTVNETEKSRVTISSELEQRLFDEWCPYSGNPDPRTVWKAAFNAARSIQHNTPLKMVLSRDGILGKAGTAVTINLPPLADPMPELTVRLTSFPESNGKRNWTAMFVRTDKNWDGLLGNCGGITIARGECWNRVAYEAERAKFLIGERSDEPWILDYGDDITTPEEWKGERVGSKRKKHHE